MTGLHSGYLTSHQMSIWGLMRGGLTEIDIARKLNVSRQAAYQMVGTISEKIGTALSDAAKLNRIEPRHVDISKGILFGWSRDFKTEAVVALNPNGGLRVWYQHNLGECNICPTRRQCKSFLLENAKDLGVQLTRVERRLDPSVLSSIVFSKYMGQDSAQIVSKK